MTSVATRSVARSDQACCEGVFCYDKWDFRLPQSNPSRRKEGEGGLRLLFCEEKRGEKKPDQKERKRKTREIYFGKEKEISVTWRGTKTRKLVSFKVYSRKSKVEKRQIYFICNLRRCEHFLQVFS